MARQVDRLVHHCGSGNLPRADRCRSRVFQQAPRELCSVYQDHISVQADKLAEVYIGKWLRVSGTLDDVHHQQDGIHVSLVEYLQPPAIHATFHDSAGPHLFHLQRNSPISLIGQIKSISAYNVFLGNCELP
jgi:hypothetical protein